MQDQVRESVKTNEIMVSQWKWQLAITERAISGKAKETREKLQKVKSELGSDIRQLEAEKKRVSELSVSHRTIDSLAELQRVLQSTGRALDGADTSRQVARDAKQRGATVTWDDIFALLRGATDVCEGDPRPLEQADA